MDDVARETGRTELIPLFPLSNVALFPLVHCPLHVFEPRYRQMTAAVLEGARRIGMATVLPEHQGDMAGDPPLFTVGCAGTVRRAERREDGRYDIVLKGAERFRILEELPREPDRLYRVARVALLEEELEGPSGGIRLAALRVEAVELLGELLRYVAPDVAPHLDPRRFAGVDDATFVSALCQMLELPPAEKQGLLEAHGPGVRCERLVALLQFRIAELAGGLPAPTRPIH